MRLDRPEVVMPFGKHAGTPIGEVDTDYLVIILNEYLKPSDPFRATILEELEKRDVDPDDYSAENKKDWWL